MQQLFYVVLLVSVFCMSYYFFHLPHPTLIRRIIKVPNIANSSITALGDNRTFILSPYYDPRGRKPSVRVLTIIHHSVTELYCWFHCDHDSSVSVRAHIDFHREWFGYPYGTAALLCAEPPDCPYRYISVHWSKDQNITHLPRFKVRNRPPPAVPSVDFTVCISTMYGDYNNVLQTIQSLEMYKLLGAGRVTLYLNQCHQNLEKVLRYYVEEGILEVIPWPIHKFLRTSKIWRYSSSSNSQVHYFAQSAALNDCLYRNMYSSKFVLLNDIDEIILPVKHHDWPSLVESLQQEYPESSVFYFENHIFTMCANSTELPMWRDIPGVNILRHYCMARNNKFINATKLMVDPRRIYQTSIHTVLKSNGKRRHVSKDLAILYHTKATRTKTGDQLPTEDRTLWRYNVFLQQSVNKVIQRVFFHG